MFIKEVKKRNSKKGKVFLQYHLIQSLRVEGKPRQRIILYLGYHQFLEDKEKRKIIAKILENKIYERTTLFPPTNDKVLIALVNQYHEKYKIKYNELDTEMHFSKPPTAQTADIHAAKIHSFEVVNSRTLGAERLCYGVLKRLKLDKFLAEKELSSLQIDRAFISIISRAIFTSSEHKTAQYLELSSSLNELFNKNYDEVSRYHLYDISDVLYSLKEHIDKYLYNTITSMFELEDKLVIYDLSNSHFEGRKQASNLAKHGRNKQKRNDCKQVVFTGVINEHGFIRHSRIYEGNTSDCVTLADMLADLKKHSTKAVKQTVVIDAGLATEENIQLLKKEGLNYVCVLRQKVKNYQEKLSENKVVIKDKNGSPIVLTILKTDATTEPSADGDEDTIVCVKSERKARKERAMDEQLTAKFEQSLQTAKDALSKLRGTKKIDKVQQRIGRIKEKNKTIQAKYTITVSSENGIATDIAWKLKPITKDKNPAKLSEQNQGVYFIKTNLDLKDADHIWNVYNTIRDVEATFRCLKSDLQIRPIHHQKDGRIEAHIYLTILAYQLVNTIRYLLKQKNINHDWKNILRIMNTQHISTVEVITEDKTIGIRNATRPIKEVLEIYKAVEMSSMPSKKKKYVVYH